jgi:hypothetical protein
MQVFQHRVDSASCYRSLRPCHSHEVLSEPARLILRILDSDAQQIYEIEAAAVVPEVDSTITFEIAPGEVVTRYVSSLGAIRYRADAVIVEIDTSPLADDEDP